MHIRLIVIFSFVLTIVACQTIEKSEETVASIDVNFKWTQKSGCSQISPRITLNGVPEETASLQVSMVDIDDEDMEHGGGIITYSQSNVIKEGALDSYIGPCPSSRHTYEITVEALDESGDYLLAIGSKKRNYPK